jgi:hypothetical protein
LIDEKNNIDDISKKVKLTKEKTHISIESLAGKDIGNYTFEIIVNNITLITSVRVKDKIKIRSLHYSINNKKDLPNSFNYTVTYPNNFDKVKEVNEGQFIHFVIETGFEKSKKKPQ